MGPGSAWGPGCGAWGSPSPAESGLCMGRGENVDCAIRPKHHPLGDIAPSRSAKGEVPIAVIPPTREPKGFEAIQLPVPSSRAEMSVFAALQERKTTREIGATPLPLQLLSNLLWAADGVNRKIGPFGIPGRTAASASNSQEIDLYVALSEGVYVYDAVNNLLSTAVAGDFRVDALTPGQRGIDAKAPVQLIYVVDVHRLTHTAGFQDPGLQDPEYRNRTILLTRVSSPATYICSLPHRDWRPGSTTATRPASRCNSD